MVPDLFLIDTHAHIYEDRIFVEIDQYVQRAKANKINMVMMPNIDLESIDHMLQIETKYPNCMAMMGLHPCHVNDGYLSVLRQMESWFDQRNFIGVGETGIDLYWDKTFLDQQKAAFDIQISWARERKLPVIIHSRDSIDLCIDMIKEQQDGTLSGVFHCFTGDYEQAQQIKDLGFYIGIGGVVTYKNSDLPGVLLSNGLSNVVLETDSPYLPPVPHRGKLNEPSFLIHIAEKLSLLFEENILTIADTTSKNARQLFNL